MIISLTTLNALYKLFEEFPRDIEGDGYIVPPEQFCEVFDIGSVIIDETHQHLHGVFKFLMYTHVNRVIALTATLLSDNYFIKKMQYLIFPKHIRYDKLPINKYIKCYSLGYTFENMEKNRIRTTEFRSKLYSHNAFEKSLMLNNKVLINYVNMIDYLIQLGFIEGYKPGDKLAIFVARVEFATYLTQILRSKYPYMDVRRYVKEDPYENLIDADIRITTILSGGTAMDIPGLVCSIMTTNIKSSVSNLQTLGRLRELKDKTVKFYYIYCHQIPKHVEYNKHRMSVLKDYVETIKEFQYSETI